MDIRQTIYPAMRSKGPKTAKIMAIGEAPGAEEQMMGMPFVGWSGKELDKLLEEAGISPASVYMTNVFRRRPNDNKIENFCVRDKEKGLALMPALHPGQYVMREFHDELQRLYDEIEEVGPNVILAAGNTPCWALFRQTPKITGLRGRVRETTIRGKTYKILPTFHPAYILRNWKERVILLQDLHKLKREARTPRVILPERQILIDPTFQEAMEFLDRAHHANQISIDVETREGQITVCGIALSPYLAAVIPFVDDRTESGSYWTFEHEVTMVKEFRKLCGNPYVTKITQNGIYDMSYFWHNWRAPLKGFSEDTMLMAHALWPELSKDLGTLASVHTDEAGWKTMRLRNRDDIKRDE